MGKRLTRKERLKRLRERYKEVQKARNKVDLFLSTGGRRGHTRKNNASKKARS